MILFKKFHQSNKSKQAKNAEVNDKAQFKKLRKTT